MASLKLTDLVAHTEEVAYGDGSFTVRGLTILQIATLLKRFPDLLRFLGTGKMETDAIAALAPDLIAAIIATGCGEPEAEDKVGLLPIGVQADVMAAIVRLTIPQGFGPFVDALTLMAENAGTVSDGKDQATNLPPQLND